MQRRVQVLGTNVPVVVPGRGRSGGGASFDFSPLQIRDLLVWYKADAIIGVSDGGEIATWPDSSGNGRHVSQAVASKRPLFQENEWNGLPVVQFDGTDDEMSYVSWPAGQTQATAFIVFDRSSIVGTDNLRGAVATPQATGDGFIIWQDSTSAGVEYGIQFGAGVGVDIAYKGTDDAGPVIGTAVIAATGGTGRFYVNGVEATAGVGTTDLNIPSGTFYVGSGGGLRYTFGKIAEIIVYSRALDSSERLPLENYLNGKWGIY